MLFLKIVLKRKIMSGTNTEGENLSRIREILFGEDLSSMESKFQLLRDESEKKFEELRKHVQENFDSLSKAINKEKETFEEKHEEKFVEQNNVNENLKQEIVNVNEVVISETKKLEKLMDEKQKHDEQNFTAFENKVMKMLDKINTDLGEAVSEMKNNKADNDAIADMFQEMANKFRK